MALSRRNLLIAVGIAPVIAVAMLIAVCAGGGSGGGGGVGY